MTPSVAPIVAPSISFMLRNIATSSWRDGTGCSNGLRNSPRRGCAAAARASVRYHTSRVCNLIRTEGYDPIAERRIDQVRRSRPPSATAARQGQSPQLGNGEKGFMSPACNGVTMIADRLRNHRHPSAKPALLSQDASEQTGSEMRNSLERSVALNQPPIGSHG